MSEYLIQGDTLTGIADAIRAKTGGSEAIAVSGLAEAIAAIQSGGASDVKMGTFTLTEGVANYTVTHDLGKIPNLAVCFLMVYSMGGPNAEAGSRIMMYAHPNDTAGGIQWASVDMNTTGTGYRYDSTTKMLADLTSGSGASNSAIGCYSASEQDIKFGGTSTYGLYTPGMYFWIVGYYELTEELP